MNGPDGLASYLLAGLLAPVILAALGVAFIGGLFVAALAVIRHWLLVIPVVALFVAWQVLAWRLVPIGVGLGVVLTCLLRSHAKAPRGRFDTPAVRDWVFADPRNMLTWAARCDLPTSRAAKWNLAAAIWLGGCALVAYVGGVSWMALAETAVGGVVATWLVSTAPAATRAERARIARAVAVDRPEIRAALAEEHALYGCHERFGCHRGCRYGTTPADVEPVSVGEEVAA